MKLLFFFLLFAALGVAHEVLWTSYDSFKKKNWRMKGRSSLWMFPIYGGVLFIVMLVQWLYGDYPWWLRGLMYAGLIIVWEYLSGFFFKSIIGVAPWDYAKYTDDGVGSPKKFHLHGLICLEYFPIWFVEGLLAEILYLFLQSHVVF